MDELISLSAKTLQQMTSAIQIPRYRRNALKPGIIHIGLGNFHRAHQAWYLHRLFNQGFNWDWAILGAGVRQEDAFQREKLLSQDCLTTLIELDPSGKSAEIIASMIGYIPVERDNQSLIARLAQPDIRIVSLTVTEGGYYVSPATGGFDERHPDILHDTASPAHPRTAFGAIIAALKLRRDNEAGPFTIQSCDNLQGNGGILRRTVLSLARMSDPDLADWIAETCSFPNSMVDCIVPATGPKEISLARNFGIDDQVPVTHENFRQWVLEDNFCAGRPDWDRVGVTFSNQVHLYEAMKLRILNGGHQIIAMPGQLLGLETIADTMHHSAVGKLLRKTVSEEIVPHVVPVPGTTPSGYFDLIVKRFSNPEIKDTTRRVAFDGSSRQSGFLVPSIRDGLTGGTPIDGLALSSALWCKYCEGVREDGSIIEPNDPNWTDLHETALMARSSPKRWLEMHQYYGDLSQSPHFEMAFCKWHETISKDGVENAINTYLSL